MFASVMVRTLARLHREKLDYEDVMESIRYPHAAA